MYQNRTCGFGPSLDVSIAASIAGAHVRVGFQSLSSQITAGSSSSSKLNCKMLPHYIAGDTRISRTCVRTYPRLDRVQRVTDWVSLSVGLDEAIYRAV